MTLRFVIAAFIFLSFSSQACACGKERWPIKVLTDPDRHLISRVVKSGTVVELGAVSGPPNSERTAKSALNHRIADAEKTTYIVKAILIGYRQESDGDFHLVLTDVTNSDATMIAEIPDPACIQDSALKQNAGKFRAALVSRFGTAGKKTKRLPKPVPVTIRGVGFFDIEHATEQDGKAPNNLELHPVLGMSLGSGGSL
jgi:hypothetical protein